eukprot:scaffold3228_cov384-Prasinococcus_capsulatus_cf.AAC.7
MQTPEGRASLPREAPRAVVSSPTAAHKRERDASPAGAHMSVVCVCVTWVGLSLRSAAPEAPPAERGRPALLEAATCAGPPVSIRGH